jgi:hypothetical protein
MSFWQWSTTATSNQNSDNNINWVEGQAPSTLNDGARAMMAVLAAWRQDTSGQGVTTGGPVHFAYTTVASSTLGQATPSTPLTGMQLTLTFNTGPTVNPDLAVDGGTAFPLKLGGAAPVSGALTTATPYHITFDGANWDLGDFYPVPFTGNVSTGQLPANQIIREFTSARDGGGAVVPTGVMFYFYIGMSLNPTSWFVYGDGNTGSCVIDFQNSAGTSQAGTQKPTISSAVSAGPSSASTWTNPINPGFYRFNIQSLSTFQKVTVGFLANAV